jgi:hypothetical protein
VDGISCATAALPLRRASVVAINKRLIIGFSRHGADRPERRLSIETKHGYMQSPDSKIRQRAGHPNFDRLQPAFIAMKQLR